MPKGRRRDPSQLPHTTGLLIVVLVISIGAYLVLTSC